MKSTFRITMAPLAFTLTVLLCGTLSAQSVADRFKQLDKDGDGKLSTSEASTLGFFKPADSNRDGLVTLQEAEAFAKNSLSPPAPRPDRNAGMEGDGASTLSMWNTPASAMVFTSAEETTAGAKGPTKQLSNKSSEMCTSSSLKRSEALSSCLAKTRVPRALMNEAARIQTGPTGIRNSILNTAISKTIPKRMANWSEANAHCVAQRYTFTPHFYGCIWKKTRISG